MSARRVAAIALLLLPLVVSGCSIPTWVPLLGKSKAAGPAEAPKAQPSTSAPILTSRDQLHASEDVVGLRVAARALGIERVEAGGGRAVLTFAASTPVTPSQMLKAIAASRGALKLRKEYTVEARIPAEPWPAVRDALAKLLDSLR